jgi:hypothetical protein
VRPAGEEEGDRYRPPPELRPAIRDICQHLIEVMRPAAKDCGYALAVHGSQERDLDVIAVPWTAEAVSGDALARCLEMRLREARGARWFLHGPATDSAKPHGRRTLILTSPDDGIASPAGRHPFIDLSIMPRLS